MINNVIYVVIDIVIDVVIYVVYRFMPALTTGSVELLVFINDDEDKNEETFSVKVNYILEEDED